MADEDKSAVSSLIGSLVGGIADNSKLIIDKGRLEKVKLTLALDAAQKTVMQGGYSGGGRCQVSAH